MVIPILGLWVLLHGGQSVDTYGKSQSEVLKMGQRAWYDFYTSKAGDSTAAMSNAYGIYADIASARNDRLLAEPGLPHRKQISRLRKMLLEFGSDMITLGTEITGGGTMWNTISAQEYAEAQDTIYAVIHPTGQPKAKHLLVSDVLGRMAKIPAIVKTQMDTGIISKDEFKTAPREIREARMLYLRIVKVAATFDRPASDQILKYCWDQAQQPISYS